MMATTTGGGKWGEEGGARRERGARNPHPQEEGLPAARGEGGTHGQLVPVPFQSALQEAQARTSCRQGALYSITPCRPAWCPILNVPGLLMLAVTLHPFFWTVACGWWVSGQPQLLCRFAWD